jgi:DNA-directed RNA polymerase specialized sigma24 family protein
MFDATTPSALRALAEYEKERTRKILLKIAFWSTQTVPDAKDLVQDAFLRLLDEDDLPWLKGTFLTHMSFALRDTWKEKMRRRAATERPDEGVTAGDKSVAPGALPDMELHRRRTFAVQRMLGERLLARIRDKYPTAVRVFELACQGIEEPAEQARILGCSPEDIYEAQRVLKRHGRAIKEEWELSEERRMADLRAKYQKEKKDRKDEEDDR